VRVRYYISFNEGRAGYPRVLRLAQKVGCDEGLKGPDKFFCGFFGYTFESDDPRLELLRDALRDAGIAWSERIEHVYADDELCGAALLWLTVSRAPMCCHEIRTGTTYDLSVACPACGTGAVQTSPLVIRRGRLPKKADICDAGWGCGPILVSTRIADSLRKAGLSGAELRQARACRTGEPLEWWQIIAAHVMPRISRQSENLIRDTGALVEGGREWGCDVCKRDMHAARGSEPLDIVYERSEVDPEQLPDAVQTWECFGRSVPRDDPEHHDVQGYARPLLLVKPRVMELLRAEKVRGAQFTPARIVGD